jgi:eukaryotic-like serine/threonine-protein kinase
MQQFKDPIINCPHCLASCLIQPKEKYPTPKFCPFCGTQLSFSDLKTTETASTSESMSSPAVVTLVPGHHPEDEHIQFTLHSYQILKSIGKGGMGEVFLAYDTTCGRRIALKRIRSDLVQHVQMHNRFLKEARITSQLTHPSIIPIYAIHGEKEQVYYTMPFVEGQTLKQILRKTRLLEKRGEKSDSIGGSIPALVRVFLNICQAIAYAHDKGVLHRDIKPENVIVGQYGEVLILDWGLAKLMRSQTKGDDEGLQDHEGHPLHQITHIGKVVGTISYMAPERAIGSSATIQTDIYSLGVILYQILTLYLPFKRGTLKDFRKNMHLENLYDPSEIAPYREVPKVLSRTVYKCLAKDLDQRYKTVNELIHDLESYIEGRAEWFLTEKLDVFNKADWEFQENVLIAEHIAITRGTEISDWVNLMISKSSFNENIKIETSLRIGEKGHGFGFLLSIPEASQREHLNDGYCLWLGSDQNRSTKLLRSTVEVMHSPEVYLQPNVWYRIHIEKIDNNLHLYLNDVLQFSYISHLPLVGTHVGLLIRDADFAIKDLSIFVGSQNIMVKCLAVPDAFLARKNYSAALSEYRRIGCSFPGRTEGREAMFRAGITLLEQARANTNNQDAALLFDQALEEFEKLHGTPGAPLEYLGKALTYQALNNNEEELKCFELAFRRYPKHPLLPVLKEQVVYRMNTCSRYHRLATYHFILLALRQMPDVSGNNNVKKLLFSLKKYWEPLPFIQHDPEAEESENIDNLSIATVLAFWLAKPYVLSEIIDDLAAVNSPSTISLCNALYCLIELGAWELAKEKLKFLREKATIDNPEGFTILETLIKYFQESPEAYLKAILQIKNKNLNFMEERMLVFYMQQAIFKGIPEGIHSLFSKLQQRQWQLSKEALLQVNCCRIWACLLEKNWEAAHAILSQYPLEELAHDTSLLYFLYGCWLYVTEGLEIASIHFLGALEVAHPRTWMLFSHFYNKRIDISNTNWFQKAFFWEKRQLFLQLMLFYHCKGDRQKAQFYQSLAEKEKII